jgi:phosphoglycerol transferase MdoB-like AlkP superfamily enzyme
MLDNKLTGLDAVGAKTLLGRAYGPADRQRIPLIIHLPKQTKPVLREDVAGQTDVMPTVADLVGADLTQIPHVGRSLFVNSNSLEPLNAYLPGGSFVNNRVLFMPGLGFDDGTAVTVKNDAPTAGTDVEKQDFQRMLELTQISDEWVNTLPKMKNTGELGWIPDPVARKAAKPYGYLQVGIGSKKKQ